jgi:sortase A
VSRASITPLGWVERGLIALGFALGVWSLLAAAQVRFYQSLPVPPPTAQIARLPGDAGSSDSGRTATSVVSTPDAGSWVARLEAPSVGLVATVIEGSTDQMLARAAGHIEETPLPGQDGNVGIAGHRDTTFRAVRNLKIGEPLRLTTPAGVFEYRIERTFIVNPEDVYVLDPTSTPSLTLVTCYPFTFIGHAPKRYIVRAQLTSRP